MKTVFIVGSAAFFSVACDRSSTDQTTTTSATTNEPNDTTIERLTEARCRRELACDNVGANKKWNDEAACRREIRQNVHGDYRQSECHTVLADKLLSCIDAIQNEKCDAVFDMTRVNACRKRTICKD
jgi:hypothetical protein